MSRTLRLAASLLLLRDDPLRVLMIRRSPHGTFPGALVFPGGTLDAEDGDADWLPLLAEADAMAAEERAPRIAALRETFEEVRLAITEPPARLGERAFRDEIRRAGVRLPLDRLVPFGRWITPEAVERRWDTHFFLCAAPDDAEPRCDGVETVAAHWVRPGDISAEEAGAMPFPTRMHLKRLAESASVAAAMASARARPPFAVLPRLERRGGDMVVVIPEEAGYGVTEEVQP